MPNPFATQAPLSGTAAPPKPRNPFASSAPLASGANATIGAQLDMARQAGSDHAQGPRAGASPDRAGRGRVLEASPSVAILAGGADCAVKAAR